MARVARLCLAVALLSVAIAGASGDSAVATAVKAGDVAALRTLIASKADVNARAGDGSTPLLWAAHDSNVEVARLLVAAGAQVDAANHYGVTPLLEASRTGDAAMMGLLIKAGADPARAHRDGETPLMAAARSGSVPAVRLLLDRKVDVNAAESVQKTTALMRAAAEGHGEVVSVLLKAGADPNLQGRLTSITERSMNSDHPTGGFTAVMWAARNGYEDTVRRLAEGGADLKLKNGDGASAAMVAIYNDRFDMAKTLLDLGSDPDDGSLYVAVEMRDSTTDQFAFDGSRLRPNNPNKLTALDLIDLLLERGADPHKRFAGQFHSYSMPNGDRFDNSPFFRAAVSSDAEALKVFIKHKVDLDRVPAVVAPPPGDAQAPPAAGGRGRGGNPNAGRTASMVTMTGGRAPAMTGGPAYIRSGAAPYREPGSRKPEDAFDVLMKGGANPNVKGPDGTPLLHQVAQAGNLAMIRSLAAAKVDFNQVNRDGLTALDVAEGKQPANAPANAAAAGGPGRGARGAPPAVGGARGRGGRGGAGGGRQEVAKLLRELMGLPPAPPSPAGETPAAAPAAAPADATPPAAEEAQ
jgi:ankyrin repeat protein